MKYSLKFYELAEDIKKVLAENGRKSWLKGVHKTPYGDVPSVIVYEGPIIQEAHTLTVWVSRMINSSWEPSEDSSIDICTMPDEFDIEDGIQWER